MAISNKPLAALAILSVSAAHAQSLRQAPSNAIDFGYGLQQYSRAECDSFPQSVFSYNTLSKNTLQTKRIIFRTDFSKKTKSALLSASLNELKILSREYSSTHKKSHLCINNTKIYYQNLFPNNSKIQNFHLISAYSFSIRNKNYLSVFITYITGNNSSNDIKPLLFQVKTNQSTQIAVPGFTRTSSPLCFGDFDNSETLDYASWNPNYQNKVTFFTLESNKFKQKTKYYLSLLDNIDGYLFSIDFHNSYWTNLNGNVYPLICH